MILQSLLTYTEEVKTSATPNIFFFFFLLCCPEALTLNRDGQAPNRRLDRYNWLCICNLTIYSPVSRSFCRGDTGFDFLGILSLLVLPLQAAIEASDTFP